MESFGQCLKRLRAEKSQREGRDIWRNEVAEKIGVAHATLGMWETDDRTNPSALNLLRLCEYYDCPIETLARTLAPQVKMASTQRVPLIGVFSDGKAIENYPTTVLIDVPGRQGEACAYMVRGAIPVAGVQDGDMLIVRNIRHGLELGNLVLVASTDGPARLCQYEMVTPGAKRKKIEALTPVADPAAWVKHDPKLIVGVVVALIRYY